MFHWVEFMSHHGGGGSKVKYENAFFCWLDEQLLMMEDYTYVGTVFMGDPDLDLPAAVQWGNIGKWNTKTLIVFIFYVL